MAAPSTKNIAASKPLVGGGIYVAPLGTALPTDTSTALPAAFVALGYISEEGVKPTRDTDIEKKKAWGGDIVAALLGDETQSFEFTLIEVFGADVAKFVFGAANVTVTPATASTGTKLAIADRGGKPDQCVMVIDMRHGAKRYRIVAPVADPVVTGEEPYADEDLTAYTVEVEAMRDATGVRVYRHLLNDDKTAA